MSYRSAHLKEKIVLSLYFLSMSDWASVCLWFNQFKRNYAKFLIFWKQMFSTAAKPSTFFVFFLSLNFNKEESELNKNSKSRGRELNS